MIDPVAPTSVRTSQKAHVGNGPPLRWWSITAIGEIALTLRLIGGLSVAEIAQAFLVPETTMGQRITRAKKKIAAAKVPYRVPQAADLPSRLGGGHEAK